MKPIPFDGLTAGQMFIYDGARRLFRRGAGIGQLLAMDATRQILFVGLFAVRHEQLVPFIGFVPITHAAFQRSAPSMTDMLDLPSEWEERQNRWLSKWQRGEAGVFSIELRDVVAHTLETIDRQREIEEGRLFIEATFPKIDSSGRFRTIEVHVVELS